jgi:CHASE3 domain sensor protein
MERKGDAFIVRLEVEAEVDKAAIETEVKQLYAHQLTALETQYQERLRLQSEEISHYRQTQSSLLHIVKTMAEKDSISQTFHGPVGNVAGTNQGQMTAYINQNNEAISQLITTLRASAQAFPSEQKDDVLMELDDLESDLSKPDKQEPKRIGKRLQRILAAGTAAATLAGGAATFTGDLNEFTQNVLELGNKIGLDRGAIQGNP